jgi:hypothetical protein
MDDTIKSIAIPVTRKTALSRIKRAGRPTPTEDNAAGGTVGAFRRQPQPVTPHALHRYRVGQKLRVSHGGRTIARAEAYCKVTALVPHEVGPLLYRVRSDAESFERIVEEQDLSPST